MAKVFAYHKNRRLSARERTILGSYLWAKEKKAAFRFKNTEDTEISLLSKFLKRKVAAFFLNKDGKRIHFKENDHDRPFVAFPDTDIDLNVSHSGKWIVVAVNKGAGVGVDVEEIVDIDLDICYNCFIRPEMDYILESESDRLERFFRLWTLKEAYLKYSGTGLDAPLKSFYCHLSVDKIDILSTETQASLSDLHCYSDKLDQKHWFALISHKNEWDKRVKYIDLEKTLSSTELFYTEKKIKK
jgi:4'-phosphopantetheinyl transferase